MFVRWRPLHLGLLFLQVFWLNVVLPGHQRGVVLLPGPEVKSDSHCAAKHSHACCAKTDGKKDSERKSRCAVCAFAARLTIPPPPLLTPTLLELRRDIASAKLQTLFSSDLPPVYWGRGPPLA